MARTLNKMATDLQAITVSRDGDAFAHEVLERKKAEETLRENEERLAGIVDSVTDSMIMLDEQLSILWANKVAKRLFGADLVGRKCHQVYHGRSRPCNPCIVRDCFRDGKIHEFESEIVTAEGYDMSVWCTANVAARHEDGRPKVVVEFLRDITERKLAQNEITKSLKEKEVLLKEIHHRVKNNMQVVFSLLRLHSSRITDKKDAEIFRESQNQIRSMALVHEKLYRSEDLSDIDFSDYVRHLASALFRSYAVDVGRIALRLEIEDVMLGIDAAIPCGLIINELVSNSLKYAFPDGKRGEVRIDFHRTAGREVQLSVSDNGVGIPEGLDPSSTESMGLKLIRILAEQIGGRLELDRAGGTSFRLTFTT